MMGSLKLLQWDDVSYFCDGGTYLELDTKIEIFLEEVRSIRKYHLMDLLNQLALNGVTITLLKQTSWRNSGTF